MSAACPSIGVVQLFGWNASAAWITCVGFNLWYTTAAPNKKLPNELIFHAISWGIPLLLCVIALQVDAFYQFGPPNGCWLNGDVPSLIFYTLPVLICFILNLLFMGTTIYRLYNISITSTVFSLKYKAKVLLAIQVCFVTYNIGLIIQNVFSFETNSIIFNLGLCCTALTGFFNTTAISGFSIWQKFSCSCSCSLCWKPKTQLTINNVEDTWSLQCSSNIQSFMTQPFINLWLSCNSSKMGYSVSPLNVGYLAVARFHLSC